jgi:hypothetical protein
MHVDGPLLRIGVCSLDAHAGVVILLACFDVCFDALLPGALQVSQAEESHDNLDRI